MNKRKITALLTFLILINNVNFKPNYAYADEGITEIVASNSNLTENETEEETGNVIELGTINLDYYPNKKSYSTSRDYLSNAEKEVIKFGKEKLNKDFYISDTLFKNGRFYYELIVKNSLDEYNGNENNEYQKNNIYYYNLFNSENRNKYIVYIKAPLNSAYFDPNDFENKNYYQMNAKTIKMLIKEDISENFNFLNFDLEKNFKKQSEYKDGLKIIYVLDIGDIDEPEYKLYFKPLTLSKPLNAYIYQKMNNLTDKEKLRPFSIQKNEIMENKISDESKSKINKILSNFNNNVLFNLDLKVEDWAIKKENISNNDFQYYINIKNEIDGTNHKLILGYDEGTELLSTYNVTEKIYIGQYYDFYYKILNYMKEVTDEDNLVLSNLKFDKDKNLYYFEAIKKTENDDNSDFEKLNDLGQRKKYKMYINFNSFAYYNDSGDYDFIIYRLNYDFLNRNYSFSNYYMKKFTTDYIKYKDKDNDYMYAILKDEYNKEYKLYTKQKELNEFIESDLIISKEELENQEISESIDSIKSELQGFNKSPYYFVNLEIKSNKIKSDNGKLYIEVIDKISNKTYKLGINTYNEITIKIPYELRYKTYYEIHGEVYLRTLPEEKQNEINEKIKNILGENFFAYNRSYGGHTYIGFSKNIKNGKPEYEASILYQTENEPKKFLKVKFVTDEAYFSQNIGLQRDEEISKKNEDLIINWYKTQMINVKDFIFLSRVPKKENNRYYYDVKITDNNGIEKNTKLYITQINGDRMIYERLFQKDGDEINYDTRIHFPSNRFSENNLSLTDEEINEIKNKFSGFQKNIYYNIKSINVDRNIEKIDCEYCYKRWIHLEIEKENPNEKVNIRLPIKNEEKRETFILSKREEDIPKYYISKDGTYIYFGQKNDGIGIPLNEYVKNDLKENEKIEKIDFAKDENAIRYHITDDKNNERLIDIPLTDNIKLGTPKYLIELKDSVKETRDITEKDKEIISKIFKNKYRGLVKDIKFSDKIFGQGQSYGNNAYTLIEINPKDNNPIDIEHWKIHSDSVYNDNDHYYCKVLLTSSDVDILCENICPPSMESNTEEPSLTCGCTKVTPRPIKPEDFPDPEEPNHNEPLPKVTPSDLPKTTPSNIPKTSTPPTVTNRTPITIIEPKPNEETNQIKNEEPVNNKPEVKSESRISRDIKTSDNLFILISLFSGILSLFSFVFIFLNKRKRI